MGKVIDTLANAGGLFVKGAAIASVAVPGAEFITDEVFNTIGLDGEFADAAGEIVDSVADFTASTYNAVGINGLAVKGRNLTGEDISNDFGIIPDIVSRLPDTFNEITDPDARMALGVGAVGGAILASESQPVQTVVHKGVHFTGQAARAGASAAGELTKHTGNALSAAGKATSDGVNHLMNKPETHTQGGAGNAQHRGMVASNIRAQQR